MFKQIRQVCGIIFFLIIFLRTNFYNVDFYEYRLYSHFLAVYIISDVTFKLDFIFHHLIFILSYLFYNLYLYPLMINCDDNIQRETFLDWNKSFYYLEFSTIFLNMMYLGYKNSFVKILFFLSFVYFRIFKFTYLTLSLNSINLINSLVKNNYIYNLIYFIIYFFVIINYYWLYLIVKKNLK